MTEPVSPTTSDPDTEFSVLLVEADEIGRLGLRTWLQNAPAVAAAIDVRTPEEAIDRAIADPPDTIVVGDFTAGLRLSRALENEGSDRPLLLWCLPLTAAQLSLAKQTGIRGYCAKGTPPQELLESLQQLAIGQTAWQPPLRVDHVARHSEASPAPGSARRPSLPGIQYIETELERLEQALNDPNLTLLDRAVLQGRRRELRAARWLVRQLPWPVPPSPPVEVSAPPAQTEEVSAVVVSDRGELDTRDLQGLLFDGTVQKLQSTLRNLTDIPLEIDILRPEQKRKLLAVVLQQFENLLLELRHSEMPAERLHESRDRILLDLWRETTLEFFGRYYTLKVNGQALELVDILLQDAEVIQSAILNDIPLLPELLSHVLFRTPLAVDDTLCTFGSPEATLRAEYLLHNLLVGVANAVMQPLLDNLADVEVLKRDFYDRRWLSTREIERFRNDLSWKYRWKTYLDEPRAIYESRFWLWVLTERGLKRLPIYAPRRDELLQLSGARQAVTILLEGRDALTPRLRSVVTWVGNGLVYVLTQVLGRGIGLIGRGVLENLGSYRSRPSRSSSKE